MMHRSDWLPLLTLVAMLPLAACAAEEGGEMEEMEETAEEAAPAPEESEMTATVSVDLEAKNESGVTGQATATHEADSVTVEVSISGATGEGDFPAHIHAGDCVETGGVLAPLTSLAISEGSGSSTTTLAASEVPPDQGAVIQVHDAAGTPVACGDLMGHGEMGEMEEGAMEEGAAEDTTGM